MAIEFHEYDEDANRVQRIGKIENGEIVEGEGELDFLTNKGIDLSDERAVTKTFDGPYLFASRGDSILTGRITEKDWQPYRGPQGGEGWYNPATDEVRYDADGKPSEGESEDESGGDGPTVDWQDPPSDASEYELGQRVEFETFEGGGTGYVNDITETSGGGILSIDSEQYGPFEYNLDGDNPNGLELTGVADDSAFSGESEDSDSDSGSDATAGQSMTDDGASAGGEDEEGNGNSGTEYSQRDDDHWALDVDKSVLNGDELPSREEIGIESTDPESFASAVSEFMERNPEDGAFLTEHDPEELEDHVVITAADGKAGVSISPEGDIQNLFSDPKAAPGGAGERLVQEAVARGGKTLDCYNTILPTLYADYGFRETGRMEFNPDYAPENWDYEEHGQPDVVFMAYQPETEYEPSEDYYEGHEWEEAKQESRRTANNRQSSGEGGQGIRREARGTDSVAGAANRGADGGRIDKDALVGDILTAIDGAGAK